MPQLMPDQPSAAPEAPAEAPSPAATPSPDAALSPDAAPSPDASPSPDATPSPDASHDVAPGLTTAEAERRRAAGQGNALPPSRTDSVGYLLCKHLFTLFNLLNLALAALLLLVGSYRNLLFMGVVVSNTVIGVVQELRAKRVHDRLTLLSQGEVSVLRDGEERLLPPDQLVLGDAVTLRRGNQAPADARVLRGRCEANESLLTGESEAVPKQKGDELLSGSYLTEGTVLCELTRVGVDSYAGRLQTAAKQVKHPKSQLMTDVRKIIRIVSISIVPIGLALFAKQYWALQMSLADSVTKAIGAMIGMIPEGLMLLVSVALAVGIVRLGMRRTLVSELYGIETLARVDVLCLDKTGTLTCGEMTLDECRPQPGYDEASVAEAIAAFCAASTDGGPTMGALRARCPDGAADVAASVVPFSSERKWSAVTLAERGTLVLGAPERTLTNARHAALLAEAHAAESEGLRVLCLLHSAQAMEGKALPSDIEPVALLLLSDALRDTAADTLRFFREQGVDVKILSGDSALTVRRVATLAGLPGAERCIDMSAVTDPDYDALCEAYTVFGRVSPEDKRGLVEALKRRGRSVGMVGDGVNDIPALRAADCSIAIAGGSDAARRVSQLTLLDADFSVMPHIVWEGRRVVNNISRAASLFLVKNLFSLLISVLTLALPFAYPLVPIQLTLISTFTIGLPSFFLAMQPSRERVSGDFLRTVFTRALPGGVCVALFAAALMLLTEPCGLTARESSTMLTYVAALSGLCVLAWSCRPINALRGALCALCAGLIVACVLIAPSLFELAPLTGDRMGLLVGLLCATPVLLFALEKLFGWLLRGRARSPEAGAAAPGQRL